LWGVGVRIREWGFEVWVAWFRVRVWELYPLVRCVSLSISSWIPKCA